jgi:cobalamin biosynthesis protein CobW
MMNKKLPVTVITGFLGSGKTTLIRNLLTNNRDRRIAVIVNEFGELGIDGELLRDCQVCDEEDDGASNIVELANGCLCCTVQEEFLPTMQALIDRKDRLDGIVIETSGLALPKPLVKAFQWPEIRTHATVDAVIAVVDCEAVADGRFASNPDLVNELRLADDSLDHETPLQELFEDQLACADLVILNKTDLVSPERYKTAREIIDRELPTGVKVIKSDRGCIDSEKLFGWGKEVELDLDNRPSHHDSEIEHEHDDEIISTHIEIDREFDPERTIDLLKSLVTEQEIYRIKGFIAVPHKPMRLVIQGVGQRIERYYDRPWQLNESRRTKLVFIGKSIDRSAILARLGIDE